ncbi:MAG: alpha/beta hydrolase [Burkholderiales bacterium]|nr:alpha/beta hydrolase [Burkholderiales bacterium]
MTRTPLLLIPGTLNTARVWHAATDALSASADMRVADVSSHDSMAALADAAVAGMPPRFCVAGFSLGGYIALEIMRRAPWRVAGLALVSTSARPEPEEMKPQRLKSAALALRDFDKLMVNMRPFMLTSEHLADAALNAEIDAMMRAAGAAAFERQTRAIIERADSRPDLGAIACPTLVICGRDDKVTPPRLSEELAAGIAGATLEIVDGAGHMLPLEAPHALTGALARWLARISI